MSHIPEQRSKKPCRARETTPRIGLRELHTAVGKKSEPPSFQGFAALQSNTTYCPNQFFDLVLPYFSRGVVRLVGYILYRTFAWSDRNGRPINEQHPISYRELIEQAGISRGALRQVIDEAVQANLIQRVRHGRAACAGAVAESSVFELRWHDGPYTTDPARFQGFFEGAGNRTHIPNQFFARLLPHEPLSVLKVVGSIIRFSIGFEVKRGFRRQQVALSYSAIQRYCRIGSRQDLAHALQHALASNFIEQVEAGCFDPDAGRTSKAATYGLRWATDTRGAAPTSGSESVPVMNQTVGATGSIAVPARRFNNRTGSSSGTAPAKRFRNRTGLEIEAVNNPIQQQQPAAAAPREIEEDQAARRRLLEVGFDRATAARLARSHSEEQIERQIAWMIQRNPTRNPLGLLRKAIEQDWPAPIRPALDATPEDSRASCFAQNFYAGMGDNALTPVATPSPTDLAAAAPLVQALVSIGSDDSRLEAWGRQFGKYAAQQSGPSPQPMSLALAVRRFGDAFVVWVRHDRERQLHQAAAAQREAHEARFKSDYQRYLQACEARLQELEPARHQAFLDHREVRRKTLQRLARNGSQSALMRGFEMQSARLEDFRMFFSSEVLDFAAWDAQVNQQGVPA